MGMIKKLTPEKAWQKYIKESFKNTGWIEDSKEISKEFPLSKRELFGLIILAHLFNHFSKTNNWYVGYNRDTPEPNDGFISDENKEILVEHKLIPQMNKEEVLNAILSTYHKYEKKGHDYGYGNGRTLIIYANKASRGLVRVSELHNQIDDTCPFDNVLLINTITINGTTLVIHITEQYPKLGIAEVNLNIINGKANVPYSNLKSLPSVVK